MTKESPCGEESDSFLVDLFINFEAPINLSFPIDLEKAVSFFYGNFRRQEEKYHISQSWGYR